MSLRISYQIDNGEGGQEIQWFLSKMYPIGPTAGSVSTHFAISEFRVSETARSWARIRDKNNFSPHEHTSGKEVSVEFP